MRIVLLTGLLLQSHEQIHDLADFRTPIEKVTGLDQGGVAPDPTEFLVYQSGFLKDADEPAELAMDVSDGHQPTQL